MSEDREPPQAIDPEAQKTADLISKLMTAPNEDGTQPTNEQIVRRFLDAEDELDAQIGQAKTSGEPVDENLLKRYDSVTNVRRGFNKAKSARDAYVRQTTAERLQDYSDPDALNAREERARAAFRNREQSPGTPPGPQALGKSAK